MLSLLISLLILLLVLAVFYWILNLIPIPAEFRWIVNVLIAIIFLVALISLLTGGWGFPYHPLLR
jgi:heme A synthase